MSVCPKCHAILPTHNPWCPDVQPPPVYGNSTNAPADVTREPTGGQELRKAIKDTLILYGIRGEQLGSLRPGSVARAVLALPELAALIADAERVQRVRAALDEVAAYAREITDQLDMPEAEYGPSEWRLHGDARGHRLAVSEIRRALDGEPQP